MNKKEFKIILPICLIYLGNYFYEFSLEGKKDIDWTHRHIGIFGFEIFISSILYFIGFLTLIKQIKNHYNSNNSNNQNYNNNVIFNNNYNNNNNNNKYLLKIYLFKSTSSIYKFITIVSFIFCLFTTFYQISKDVGATLVNHGQYNLLALLGFLIIYTSTFLIWSILLKYFNLKKIFIGFIVLFFSLFLIFNKRNQYILSNEFPIGLDGKRLLYSSLNNSNVCQIEKDFIVWPAFQPTGWTWIIAGSRDCPKDEPFSKLDDNQTLTINCEDDQDKSYTISPTFFEEQKKYGIFTDDLKVLEKQYKKQTFKYNEPIKINDETVMAKCGNKTEIHFQNVLNKESLERSKHFNKPILKNLKNVKLMDESVKSKPMDILFLLIDALSRAHFKRAMPLTFNTLQSIQNEGNVKVFQFFKYHSLKFYSDPNYIALYTGFNSLKYDDIDRELIDENVQRKPNEQFSYEKHPMFFQSFRNDSYITNWIYPVCEDFFDAYLKKEKPFFDHELVLPFCAPHTFPLERPFGIFEGPYSIRRRCLGNKHVHDLMLNYINQLWNNYSQRGKIVSASFMDAHEGTMEVIKIADKQFNRFLSKDFKSNLNDTILILNGDHGQHMGAYYKTKGGSIEVAFPVLYITVPNWFLNKYPHIEKNLLENENKLSSPFQLYDTIRALSKYPEFGGIDMNDQDNKRNDKLGLLGKIPDDISCSDLGIPRSFCKCK